MQPGLTLVVGPNGHGKTNLIEAVYVICLGRSFREHRDSRLIRFGEPAAAVRAEAVWGGRDHSLALTIPRGGGKRIEVDGAPLERFSELIGHIPVVSLTPEDGEMAYGNPAPRRRFLDVLLAQTDRGYLDALRTYRAALSRRNAALREGRRELAETYEGTLGGTGGVIQERRTHLAAFLAASMKPIYQEISGSGETIEVSYRPSPASEKESRTVDLTEALALSRRSDMERGFTTIGPHRDDLHLILGGRALKTYGSHGQARTALAALKLAEVDYYKQHYDRSPVLVMDEVASVLDRSRAERLVGLLSKGAAQVLVTSPGTEELGPLRAAAVQIIQVEEGTVR